MTSRYREALENKKDELTSVTVKLSLKTDELEKSLKTLGEKNKEYENLNQVKEILNKSSEICRLRAIAVMENTVNPMLKAVAGPQYSFKIVSSVLRGKPAIDFWIESEVDGETSLQDPVNFGGGGFLDIISTALRFAFISLYDGGINNAIILDEPGRMVSQNASSQFADFIKYFGTTFDRQIIMCTHNDNVEAYADRVIEVMKPIDESVINIK